jgi:hypothetical protein
MTLVPAYETTRRRNSEPSINISHSEAPKFWACDIHMRVLCLLLAGLAYFTTVKMEAVRSFETPLNFCQTTASPLLFIFTFVRTSKESFLLAGNRTPNPRPFSP